MAHGMVKWFDQEKGFGQIVPDDGGIDVFVHFTAISIADYQPLADGQRVEFEPMHGMAGRQARWAAAL